MRGRNPRRRTLLADNASVMRFVSVRLRPVCRRRLHWVGGSCPPFAASNDTGSRLTAATRSRSCSTPQRSHVQRPHAAPPPRRYAVALAAGAAQARRREILVRNRRLDSRLSRLVLKLPPEFRRCPTRRRRATSGHPRRRRRDPRSRTLAARRTISVVSLCSASTRAGSPCARGASTDDRGLCDGCRCW